MSKTHVMADLKRYMVTEMYLEGVTESDIGDETPLFGDEGLGMDSLDAVELVVLVEKHFGVAVDSPEIARKVFASVSTLADFILERRAEKA